MAKKSKAPIKPDLSKEEVREAIKEIRDMQIFCSLRGAYHSMHNSVDKTLKHLEHCFGINEQDGK